jgi:hypothetical protein
MDAISTGAREKALISARLTLGDDIDTQGDDLGVAVAHSVPLARLTAQPTSLRSSNPGRASLKTGQKLLVLMTPTAAPVALTTAANVGRRRSRSGFFNKICNVVEKSRRRSDG